MSQLNAQKRLEELEAIFAALAHTARRQILLTIWFRGGVVSSSEISKRFQHSWPTTTRHLRVLEEAGLIAHDKEGRNRFYRVNKQNLQVVQNWLNWFQDKNDVTEK